MRVVVFGAGLFGKKYISECPQDVEIVAVCDNNKINKYSGFGYGIVSPSAIPNLDFDKVVIALNTTTIAGINNVRQIMCQLELLGIDNSKIMVMCNDIESFRRFECPRVQFIYEFSRIVHERNIEGAVAECGVYQGDYAYHINNAFPDRKLYLFDTFEGFPVIDIEKEEIQVQDELKWLNIPWKGTQHEDLVLFKLIHRHNVTIKKGYIPDTFASLDEGIFAYVHLDMDMYAPTIAGLHFFAPRMSKGGVIAVHDYCSGNEFYTGVRKAVHEFCNCSLVNYFPLGDGSSVVFLF